MPVCVIPTITIDFGSKQPQRCLTRLLTRTLSPMTNTYRGVSRHPKGGWVAQATLKGKQTYLGLFAKQEDAAKCVATATKQTVEALRKKKTASSRPKVVPKQTHKHVTYHVATGKWRVTLKRALVHESADKGEAVQFAAKRLKVTAADLMLRQRGGYQGQRGARTRLIAIFRLLWRAYRRGPKRGGRAWASLPGDAAYQYARLRGPKATPYKDAGLALPFLVAKYGPDKVQIEKAAKLRGPKDDLEAYDYNRLALALKGMSTKFSPKEYQCWMQGPGTGTSHHGGLVMWLWKSLKMIEPKVRSGMPLLLNRRRFVIKPLTKPLRARLSKSRAFGEALLEEAKGRVTLETWNATTRVLLKATKGVPGLSPNSYRGKWAVRSWMDRCLRQRSWKGLATNRGDKVALLTKTFPDEDGHLRVLTDRAPNKVTLSQFCKTLGYDGPVEHLTMWLCLLLSKPLIRSYRATTSQS